MADLTLLPAAAVRRVPWRNGRGVTDELFVEPPGATLAADDVDLRVARAAVPEPGPFSAFPGMTRFLVVVQGAGLRLAPPDGGPPRLAPPLVVVTFPGAPPPTAELVAGPVADLNVLARDGVVAADVAVVGTAGPGAGARAVPLRRGDALLHRLEGDGDVRLRGRPDGVRLGPGDSLLVRGAADGDGLEVEGGTGPLVLVRWARLAAGAADAPRGQSTA